MKAKAFILLAALSLSGCSLVPTDGWPKLVPYWSQSARDHRAELAREKAANEEYLRTHPKN